MRQNVLISTLFFLQIAKTKQWNFRNGTKGVLEVETQPNEWFPLCANGFTEQIGAQICRQLNGKHSEVSTFTVIPLNSLIAVQIECSKKNSGIEKCSQTKTAECFHSIRISCLKSQQRKRDCPPKWIRLNEGKCFGIPQSVRSQQKSSFAEADSLCRNFDSEAKLASLSAISLKRLDSLISNLSFGMPNSEFITSGIRIRRKWIWGNGVKMETLPFGSAGRCLSVRQKSKAELFAADCDSKSFIPLCEINRAKDCILPNGLYDGEISETKSGKECLKWTDPQITANGYFSPQQKFWDHNFCRNPGESKSRPWCMVSATAFEDCDVEFCSETKNHVECSEREFRCGEAEECVDREFWCDYDVDCRNGADEADCPDFLGNFDFGGELKLMEEVAEIWKRIPHIQGCAQRCLQSEAFRCESFSYESVRELCSLSSVSSDPTVLFDRFDSKFYRRKFSNENLNATKTTEMIVKVEKLGIEAAVCVDRENDDVVLDSLCSAFGFGKPMSSLAERNGDPIWPIDCLRNLGNCLAPSKRCRRHLRCSDCGNGEFACRRVPQCIQIGAVCDGRVDCLDATDEIGCSAATFRLLRGDSKTPEGRVQLSVLGEWSDVCVDGLAPSDVNSLCSQMGKGSVGRILPIFGQKPTAGSWSVRFSDGRCLPNRMTECKRGILNIRCENPNQPLCGRRFGSQQKRRRRVVGGFETMPGSFPWSAAIRYQFPPETHHCGAVVISSRFLLSAAHCFAKDRDPKNFYVGTGDWNTAHFEGTEQRFNLSNIHFYPKYDDDLFQHDIVILELSADIRFDIFTQPICLPPRGYRYRAGQICMVSGWGSNGKENPRRQQAAAMPILDKEVCRNASKIYSSVSETSFCAGYLTGGVDSCQGDSGGPFACDHDGVFYLSGIISWGDGCAEPGQPGIYTMLTPYLSWIYNITGVL